MTLLILRGVSGATTKKKDDSLLSIEDGNERLKKRGGTGKSFINLSLLKGILIGASVTVVVKELSYFKAKPSSALTMQIYEGKSSLPKISLMPSTSPALHVHKSSLLWYEKIQLILAEFPPVERRLEFLYHLEKLPSFKTAIEVGVQKGILAKKSLDIWKSCTEYKLVDLWGKEEGYTEPGTDTAADKDTNLKQARFRMKPWVEPQMNPPKVEFFVTRSTDVSKHLTDHYFDYIYLDARYDYCAVKEDIEHYWPKLRPGGIIGGHDYIDAQYAIDRLGSHED